LLDDGDIDTSNEYAEAQLGYAPIKMDSQYEQVGLASGKTGLRKKLWVLAAEVFQHL
jgi:hypothetical protein